jgi:hypothetical protein
MIVQTLTDQQIDFDGSILNYISKSEVITVPAVANWPSGSPSRYLVELEGNIFVDGSHPIAVSGFTRSLIPNPAAGSFYILPYTTSTDESPLAYMIEFNSADAGATPTVTYSSVGSPFTKNNVNNEITRAVIYSNQLSGLTLSNNTTDANNDIDIAIGGCIDSTGTEIMALLSGITKRLDAAWSVGTNQGGLDTGSKANSTWYYLYVVKRLDTNVVDVIFSASATSPTLPANYSVFRKIGAVVTDGSGNIRGYIQIKKGKYRFKSPPVDRALTGVGSTNRTELVVTCPPNSIGTFETTYYVAAGVNYAWVHETTYTDVVASINNMTGGSSTSYINNNELEIYVDSASKIAFRADGTGLNLAVRTVGFELEL